MSLTYENEPVQPPTPLKWYPDSLAWQITVRKEVIRKEPSFKKFQNFLVCESEAGNISRQEAVSMIPPLFLDLHPHHKVVDLCAAPGSKTAQILEALNVTGIEQEGSGGLVIANDMDNKRCYTMIHQLNRSPSAMYMATCYDASHFPNLRISGQDGNDEILKFDRVLADVPCSGDGTLRKNESIWKLWTNKSGMGLHPLQIRILYRGLQMLAVNGRLVYSTCSLNPLENEAVVAEVLRRTQGVVEVIDISDELPDLIRRPGMQSWKVFDSNNEEMEPSDFVKGGRITETMFPPTSEEEDIKRQLSRCIRIYPHLQDTGGFFIAVLKKSAPLTGAKAPEPKDTATNGTKYSTSSHVSDSRSEQNESPSTPTESTPTEEPAAKPLTKPQPYVAKEEPFVYLPSDHPDLLQIRSFYNLSPTFPTSTFFVRNATGEPLHAIYITNPLVKNLIHRNPTLRLLNAGTRLFQKQADPKSGAEVSWRMHADGLSLIDPFLGEERVVETVVEELKELLKDGELFPLIKRLSEGVRKQIEVLKPGGFVIRVKPGESKEVQVPFSIPMWRSGQSVKYHCLCMDRVDF